MTAALAAAGYRADVAALRRRRREHEAAADPASPAAAAEVLTLRHREVVLTGGRPEELLAVADQVDDALARFPPGRTFACSGRGSRWPCTGPIRPGR